MLTIRELIKTLYNALLQRIKKYRGNWEQNDPTAEDYIKNRPFYMDGYTTIIKSKTFVTYGNYEWCSPFVFEIKESEAYKIVWDGKEYECVAYIDEMGNTNLGNMYLTGEGKNTGEPFFFYYFDASGRYGVSSNIEYGWCVKNSGTHTVSVYKQNIKKIDKKYIDINLPNNLVTENDLANVAFSGNYYDLYNQPTIYTDVVRTGITQNLGTTAKNRARTNIGAVGYESQSLSDTQKAQARTNIGAGTSNFSGNYNDLTNKPTGLATETYVSGQISTHNTSTTAHSDIRKLIPSIDGLASEEYVDNKVAAMVDSAPETLNTLKELAAALGDDPNFATTILTQFNTLSKQIAEPKDSIVFVDQVNRYHYIACMRDGNFVTYCATKSIEITTMPVKTEYVAGEYFDPTGMIVVATYYDGTTKEITDYTCPITYLTEGVTSVEITCVEGGITHAATVPVIVIPFDPTVVLVDFEYTTNEDGTYTITDWKGTLNGETSTELIIPNNGLIVV